MTKSIIYLKKKAKVQQLNAWMRYQNSHPIQFHIIIGVWGHSELWWTLDGYVSFQNKACEQTELETIWKIKCRLARNPHFFTQYIFMYVYSMSTFFQKELNVPWHFSISTKQVVLSSFHNMQIFIVSPTKGNVIIISQSCWHLLPWKKHVLSFYILKKSKEWKNLEKWGVLLMLVIIVRRDIWEEIGKLIRTMVWWLQDPSKFNV